MDTVAKWRAARRLDAFLLAVAVVILLALAGAGAGSSSSGRACKLASTLEQRLVVHVAHASPASLSYDELAASAECPGANWSAVAFLHVPKAAGSSYIRVLESMGASRSQHWCPRFFAHPSGYRYRPFQDQDSWDCAAAKAELIVDGTAAKRFPDECQGFRTHLSFNLFETIGVDFGRHLTVVNMRRPVDRLVSHYFFWLHAYGRCKFGATFDEMPRCDPAASAPPFFHAVFKQIVEGGMAHALRRFATRQDQGNRMVAQLAGNLGCPWRGKQPPPQEDGRALLAKAKARLARFCVLLIKERSEESLQLLAAAANGGATPLSPGGQQVSAMPDKNVTPHPAVPPQLLAELAHVLQLDTELYNFGLQLFEARLRRLRADIAAER